MVMAEVAVKVVVVVKAVGVTIPGYGLNPTCSVPAL